MIAQSESAHAIHSRTLAHLILRINSAEVWNEPFTHTYFTELFPSDIYDALLANLPPERRYQSGARDPNGRHEVRSFFNLTAVGVRRLPVEGRNLWSGVAAALTDPTLKQALFSRLAPDLMYRYGIDEGEVPDLDGFPRPTLYREIEGYEIPPHPDTLKKVVTMHLYLPSDLSQIDLGTALYQPMPGVEQTRDWQECFTKVKQFEFRPNSGYAFVVNHSLTRQSWHGRERLTEGCGVRNTLLNTFYTEPRYDYAGYLEALPS